MVGITCGKRNYEGLIIYTDV